MTYERTKLCQLLEKDRLYWEEKAAETQAAKRHVLEQINKLEES